MSRLSFVLDYPFQGLQTLRRLLNMTLLADRQHRLVSLIEEERPFTDETALTFLQQVKFEHGNDLAVLCGPGSPAGAAAAIDAALMAGWARKVWGRVRIPHEVGRKTPVIEALGQEMLARRYKLWLTMPGGAPLPKELPAASDPNVDGWDILAGLKCKAPDWVAARLWDRSEAGPEEPRDRLRWWYDRWKSLSSPELVPSRIWSEADAQKFRDAALTIIAEEGLVGWDGFLSFADATSGIVECYRRSEHVGIPSTLTGRWLWLDSLGNEQVLHWSAGTVGELLALAGILERDRDNVEGGAAVRAFEALICLSTTSPELLHNLVWRTRRAPASLADFLLHPETPTLACLLIARWHTSADAWDRESSEAWAARGKEEAFRYAVQVLGARQSRGPETSGEVADLLRWLQREVWGKGPEKAPDCEMAVSVLRQAVASWQPEQSLAVYDALADESPTNDGMAAIIASLELAAARGGGNGVGLEKAVDRYLGLLETPGYDLSVRSLSPGGAVQLCDAALYSNQDRRSRFLTAHETAERMTAKTVMEDATSLSVCDEAARSIRAHFRVLCRAVVGYKAVPPAVLESLSLAVATLVSSGNGPYPLNALAPRHDGHSPWRELDRLIAVDAAAALSALGPTAGGLLLTKFFGTNEPAFLAQLLFHAPTQYADRIRTRLAELPPKAAADLMFVTEGQTRIDALLQITELELVQQYLDVHPGEARLARLSGAAVGRVRAERHLLYLRGETAALMRAPETQALNHIDSLSALDSAAFYRGLSLMRQKGGAIEAEQVFRRLHEKHSRVAAYATNMFAARVNRLLEDGTFSQITGDHVADARSALADAEWLDSSGVLALADKKAYNFNRALLLLAIGQTQAALDMLMSNHPEKRTEGLEAAIAIAYSRLGRMQDANSTLLLAEQHFGRTPTLIAVREHVESGTGPDVVGVATDAVVELAPAIVRLGRLSAVDQARLQHGGTEPLPNMILSRIRTAAASLVKLVPKLHRLELDTSEDDLTAVLSSILEPGFRELGWTVAQQSPGGFSETGRSGERDLTLSKDGIEYAVVEAVACRRPITHEWMREDLRAHLLKLVGYATCEVFAHLTYAINESTDAVLDHMKVVVQSELPSGYHYLGASKLPHDGTAPPGLMVHLALDGRSLFVAILVLDMRQAAQSEAAKAAGSANPRNRAAKVAGSVTPRKSNRKDTSRSRL